MVGRVLFVALLLLLSGCGYTFRRSHEEGAPPSISIPYVVGDEDGRFTDALALAVSNDGAFRYVSSGGQYTLQVKIISDGNERIGYRYDRNPISGKREKNLTSIESRRTIAADITVMDGMGNVVVPPYRIESWGDFDFVDTNSIRDLAFMDSNGKSQKVIQFSAGQLDSIEGGEANALHPIYQKLAQKISRGLRNMDLFSENIE